MKKKRSGKGKKAPIRRQQSIGEVLTKMEEIEAISASLGLVKQQSFSSDEDNVPKKIKPKKSRIANRSFFNLEKQDSNIDILAEIKRTSL